MSADLVNALSEIMRLRAKLADLERAIKFVVGELEEDFDAEDGQPNKAMKLANELDEALYGPGGF